MNHEARVNKAVEAAALEIEAWSYGGDYRRYAAAVRVAIESVVIPLRAELEILQDEETRAATERNRLAALYKDAVNHPKCPLCKVPPSCSCERIP